MADNQPMSQDDIDALLAQMSGAAGPAAKPAETPAAPAAPGTIDQDEMDRLVAAGTASAAAAPAAKPPAEPAAGVASGSLDQGDIDQLLSSLGVDDGSHGSAVAVPAPLASAAPPPPPPPLPFPTAPAAAPAGPLGQDDIDALLGQLQQDAAPPAKPAEAGPAPDRQVPAAAAPVAPAPAVAGPLGQDDIDALVGQLAEAQAAAPPAPAAAAAPPPTGPLGQDDIDALVNQLAGAAPPAEPAAAPPPLSKSGTLGQDDIDALVNQLAGDAPAAKAAPAAAPAAAQEPPPGVDADIFEGRLDQDKIDRLLAQLGADVGAKAEGGAAAAAPGSEKFSLSDIPPLSVTASTATALPSAMAGVKTIALSTEDLDALVAKHSGPEGGAGASSETMIAQADIDALVQQLAGTGGEPEPAAQQAVTKALAKHDAAIDKLLNKEAGDAARATVDALDPRLGGDKRPSSQPAAAAAAPTVAMPAFGAGPAPAGVAAMAPTEVRWARWLLIAAVFLLTVCATTLVVVTSALHGLTGELKAERLAQANPAGDFGEDWKLALARLEDADPDQRARGEKLLERLRGRYPGHEAEIALVLARHHRAQGEWKRSAAQYASLLEGAARLMDDPRIYLEYAEVLDRCGERPAAVRQVYVLLANEQAWTAERDLRRIPRPAREVAANRLVMQEANLLLGRLVGEAAAPAMASAAGHAAAPAGHAAAPAAAGHGGGH